MGSFCSLNQILTYIYDTIGLTCCQTIRYLSFLALESGYLVNKRSFFEIK
mgnify:CR=1 FL=1|jgi:hypothetical protein